MTVGSYLQQATQKLRAAGVHTARLDCLVLLEDVLGVDRALLLAAPERKIEASKITELNTFITQRERHIPLAYIRGRAAFFGRTFVVNKHTLVPRPETESMIEMLLNLPLGQPVCIADIGTGTGCLGITAALEIPTSDVWLIDIDQAALQVARKNATALGANTHTYKQDLLGGSAAVDMPQFNVILANLPYVPKAYPINKAATYEPSVALFAGKDGLNLYRRLWEQVATLRYTPQHIFVEALPIQQPGLIELAQTAGYTPVRLDEGRFIQHFTPIRSVRPAALR